MCGLIDVALPNDEVTKMLALIPLLGVVLDHGLHDLKDLILFDRAPVELVQALTVVATSKVHVVRYIALTD